MSDAFVCFSVYSFVRLFSCVSCLYILSTAVMRRMKDVQGGPKKNCAKFFLQ